ncbi:hypothetical protein [Micromonospora sp. DT233]|uniref:hypothetical protein n=1 Tax=Micromonospora sp. DT233 TaxID=3393432 RepID=UPI003CF941B3
MTIPDSDVPPTSTFSFALAARAAVERMAPEELGFLDDVLASWERGDLAYQRGRRQAGAGTVGFGVDLTLVAETVLAVLTAAASDVLGTAVGGAWQQRPRWWRRGRAGRVLPSAQEQFALSDGQADRLRDACRRHGRALGLSAEQADLLADAVYGAVEGARG